MPKDWKRVRTYLYSIQSHKTTPWSVTALAVRTVDTRPIQATVLNELTRDSRELHSLQMQFKLTCVWTYRIRHSVTKWWNSNCLWHRPANERDFHEHDIIILLYSPDLLLDPYVQVPHPITFEVTHLVLIECWISLKPPYHIIVLWVQEDLLLSQNQRDLPGCGLPCNNNHW